jgi:hypothetical protein
MPFVQGIQSDATKTNGSTLALPGNATAGNHALVFCTHSYEGCPVSITDSQGNTYTRHLFVYGTVAALYSVFSAPIANSAALTITFNMACGQTVFSALHEVSGLQASPFDQSNRFSNTSSPSNPGAVTPTTDSQYIAVWAIRAVTGTFTAISPFTDQMNDGTVRSAFMDYIQPTAGAITPTMTTSAGGYFPVDMVVATFKTTAPATGHPTMRRLSLFPGFRPTDIGREGGMIF